MLQSLATAQGVGAGGSLQFDVDTRRLGILSVVAKLNSTTTVGDLVYTVQPFDDKGNVIQFSLPTVAVTAIASNGTDVGGISLIDVSGIEKVRIRITNNNAGSLAATVVIYGDYGGRG